MPDLADILAGRGSVLLGAGGFSIVVADPECRRTAIEIGPLLPDAGPARAAFALDHEGPHIPVVHGLRFCVVAGRHAAVLRRPDGAAAPAPG